MLRDSSPDTAPSILILSFKPEIRRAKLLVFTHTSFAGRFLFSGPGHDIRIPIRTLFEKFGMYAHFASVSMACVFFVSPIDAMFA